MNFRAKNQIFVLQPEILEETIRYIDRLHDQLVTTIRTNGLPQLPTTSSTGKFKYLNSRAKTIFWILNFYKKLLFDFKTFFDTEWDFSWISNSMIVWTPLVSSTVMSNFVNLAVPKYHYGWEKYHQPFFSVMLNTINSSNTMQSIFNGHAKYHQQSC